MSSRVSLLGVDSLLNSSSAPDVSKMFRFLLFCFGSLFSVIWVSLLLRACDSFCLVLSTLLEFRFVPFRFVPAFVVQIGQRYPDVTKIRWEF